MIDLKRLPSSSGIYCIENTMDNKRYIGKSVNIRKRISRHNGELMRNRHHNQHLQHAWNLYGSDAFIAYPIELCDKYAMDGREIYYIHKLNTTVYGYNLTSGGEGALGRPVSDTTREKIRSKQPDFNREKSPRARPVVLLNTGECFSCLIEASEKYNVVQSSISSCCRGNVKSAGRANNIPLVWAYLEDYLDMTQDDISTRLYGGKMAKAGGNNSHSRRVLLKNTGEIFDCMKDASKAYHTNSATIANCCKQRRSYAGKHNGEKLVWEFCDKEVVAC